MQIGSFITDDGCKVPAISESQMREIERMAVYDFGLSVLQMMENAGRSLALNAMEMIDHDKGEITVLAGLGGQGGGGLCCARHLHNRGFGIHLILSKEAATLTGAAQSQLHVLIAAGLVLTPHKIADQIIQQSDLIVDALIGYNLHGPPKGEIANLIEHCNESSGKVLSLDLPSGMDATTGETPGLVVKPDRTLTLALPKHGLIWGIGEMFLADIGIPPQLFERMGIKYEPVFGGRFYKKLSVSERS